MKKFLKGFSVLTGLLLIVAASFFIYAARGLDRDIPLEARSAAELENGRYQGEDEGGRWSKKVEVVVGNREITDIIIIDEMLFILAEFSQGIIENVLKNQQTDPNAVTSSTITSQTYLKAIENALDPQEEETR